MHTLFTYGTLRSSERNHVVLARLNPTYLANDSITAEYCGWWGDDIPLIKEGDGEVHGECYSVDDAGLARLDFFEGTHSGMYNRKEVTTNAGRKAFVYFPGEELLQVNRG